MFKPKNLTAVLRKFALRNFTRPATTLFSEDKIMDRMIQQTASMSAAVFRVAMLVVLMTGPVLAVTMMKANNGPKFSGVGLVLVVSLERVA